MLVQPCSWSHNASNARMDDVWRPSRCGSRCCARRVLPPMAYKVIRRLHRMARCTHLDAAALASACIGILDATAAALHLCIRIEVQRALVESRCKMLHHVCYGSAWRSETQSSSSLSVQTQLCRFGKLCGHQSSSSLAQLAQAR